jgi:antitoxin YefM
MGAKIPAPLNRTLDKAYDLPYAKGMTTLTTSQARAKLYRLVDSAAKSHEPVQITGRRSSAVLVSEEDWRAIQETLHLLSVPGMRESIRQGLKTPPGKLSTRLKW